MAAKSETKKQLKQMSRDIKDIKKNTFGNRAESFKTALYEKRTEFSKSFATASQDFFLQKMNQLVEGTPRALMGNFMGIASMWEKGLERHLAQHRHLIEKGQKDSPSASEIASKMVAMKVHGNVFLSVAGGKVINEEEQKHMLRNTAEAVKVASGITDDKTGIKQTLAKPANKRTKMDLPFFADMAAILETAHRLGDIPDELHYVGTIFNKMLGTHFGNKADARKLKRFESREFAKGIAKGLKSLQEKKNTPWYRGGLNPLRGMPQYIEGGLYKAFPTLPKAFSSSKELGQHFDPNDEFGLMQMPDFQGTKKEIATKRAKWSKFRKSFARKFISLEENQRTGRVYRAEAMDEYDKFMKSDIGREAGLDKGGDRFKGMRRINKKGESELRIISPRNLLRLIGGVGGKALLGSAYVPLTMTLKGMWKTSKVIGKILNKTDSIFRFSDTGRSLMRDGKKAISATGRVVKSGLGMTTELFSKAAKAFIPMLASVVPMIIKVLPWAALIGLTIVAAKKAWDIGSIVGEMIGNWWTKKDPSEEKLQGDKMVGSILEKEFGSEMSPERIARAKELNTMVAKGDLDELSEEYRKITGASVLPKGEYLPMKAVPGVAIERGTIGVGITGTTPTGIDDVTTGKTSNLNVVNQLPTTNNNMSSYTTIETSYNHAKNNNDDLYGGGSW